MVKEVQCNVGNGWCTYKVKTNKYLSFVVGEESNIPNNDEWKL